MGESGLRFHLAGFPVHVPVGGILGVLLIAYLWAPSFAGDSGNGLALAGVFAVLLYLSVLVHELAHAWAAKAFGYPVHGITLWLLGGYTVYERRNSRPWPEFVIAVIGPVSTLVVALACWLLTGVTSGAVAEVLAALTWTNVLLGALNLLPGAPLDGGGVVKAVVWRISGSEHAGGRAAGYAGLVIATLLGVVAVASLLSGGTGLLLMGVLAIFIGFGAFQSLRVGTANRALEKVVGHLVHLIRPVLAVSERDTLGGALSRWDRGVQVGVVSVDGRGRLLAVLSPQAAGAVPQDRLDEVAVAPFTTPVRADQRVVLGDDPMVLLQALADSGQPYVFVTDPAGRPLGMLMAADVNEAMRAG